MSMAIPCTDCTSISNFYSPGFGSELSNLKKYYQEQLGEFRNAETIGRPVDETIQSLKDVFDECSKEHWDGYDALAIKEDAFDEARRLIELLPTTIPMPVATPEPDGALGLEWYRSNRLVFVASVSGNNEIDYAGLFGPNKIHGTLYFGDFLPKKIIENIEDLYSEE